MFYPPPPTRIYTLRSGSSAPGLVGVWAAATCPGPGPAWWLTRHLTLDYLVSFTQGSFVCLPTSSLLSCLLPSPPASKAVTELIAYSRLSAGPWGCKTLLLTSGLPASQRGYTHPLCAVRGMRRGGPIQPAGGWAGCSGESFVPSAEF